MNIYKFPQSTIIRYLLLSFICIAMSVNTYCMEKSDSSSTRYVSEHIKFMGIPMEGSFDDFRDKVIAKGFRFEMTNDNGLTILHGPFAGHQASILLQPNRKNEIHRVQLIFGDGNYYFTSWKKIANLYYELKDLLISKYGQPEECTEEFVGKKPITDKSKILAVAEEKCKYECIFTIYGEASVDGNHITINGLTMPIGSIGLHIAEQVVRLTYTDLQQEMNLQEQNFDDI